MISAVRLHIVIITVVLFIACTIDYNVYRSLKRHRIINNTLKGTLEDLFKEAMEERQGNKIPETVKGSDYDIDPVFERKIDDVMKEKSNIGRDIKPEGVIRHNLGINDDTFGGDNRSRINKDSKDTDNC